MVLLVKIHCTMEVKYKNSVTLNIERTFNKQNTIVMKSIYILTILLLVTTMVTAQVGINEDGSAPNAGSMLDIKSTTKGLLLPRMTTAQRTSAGILAKGMLIYDTDLNAAIISNGGAWDRGINSANIVTYVWGVSGTSGSNPTTNFIGTTDATDLVFKTNNTEVMRLTSGGDLGIGLTPSLARLHIFETETNATGFTINNYFNSKNAVTLSGSSAFTNSGGSRIDVSNSNTNVSNVIKGQMITVKTTGSAAADSVIGLEVNLNNSSTGTTNIEYGIKVSDISPQNGTLTNTVGLYIGDMTSGTQTNAAYSIYSADANARSYFAGKVEVGSSMDANGFNVTGRAVIGLTYAGDKTAPANGLLVEGPLSIGTTSYNSTLSVGGDMSIGVNFASDNFGPTNSLVIEGAVGIGTTSPQSTLDVEGGVAIGSGYAGLRTAPTNGLIVEGQVGIGTFTPAAGYELDVAGDAILTGGNILLGNGYQGPVNISSLNKIYITGSDHVVIGNRAAGFQAVLPTAASNPGKVIYIVADPVIAPSTFSIAADTGDTVVGGSVGLAAGTGKTCSSDGGTTWYCW
jgi:hypothetical protein